MKISRRGLLGMLAGGLVLDPERALWVPGKKLISIPAPAQSGVWYMLAAEKESYLISWDDRWIDGILS
jgi:hypothetical protein